MLDLTLKIVWLEDLHEEDKPNGGDKEWDYADIQQNDSSDDQTNVFLVRRKYNDDDPSNKPYF